ncbi:MAG: TIGR02221 family CRISPR-associated protein [Desulfobacca sp.]|uniref:TIGR02221 family CRISPR-associated protein n=1 Tax=Desulfobacca sp. TaxID=2067990 RepID=UPI0040492E35
MARVYLSFLGTNDYVPCHYLLDGQESPPVRFVQEAIVRLRCADWTAADRLVFFLTPEAARRNWEDGYFTDTKGTPQKGLHSCLQALKLPCPLQPVMIVEGRHEGDIWQIFTTVLQQMRANDQVIFDITHAFRSIPLLAMVILGYAQVIKNIKIDAIYYGAFEVLGPVAAVREMPLAQRRAPIFDLTPFSALLNWTMAIDRFLATGDARWVCELAHNQVRPILKKTKGQDQEAQAIRRLATLLEHFTKNLSTCRGQKISSTAMALQQALAASPDPELLPPFKPLLYKLSQRLQGFTGETVRDGVQAARWCLEHNLIQQGITILQETLLTHFVLQAGGDPQQKKLRDLASQAVTIFLNNIDTAQWHTPAADHPEVIARHKAYFRENEEAAKVYRNLSQPRNDINHAGYVQPQEAEALAAELARFIALVEELVAPKEVGAAAANPHH